MSRKRSTAVACGVVAVLVDSTEGCSSAHTPPSGVRRVSYQYSCCSAADVEPVRQPPGEMLTLHWVVTPSRGSEPERPSEAMTLASSLTGAFSDVASLKRVSPSAATTIQASDVTTTTWMGGAPTSIISIPATASPGMYNLSIRITSGGPSVGGDTVIQVARK